MVQRSATHIDWSGSLIDEGGGGRSFETAVTTEKSDLIFTSLPYRILHALQLWLHDKMRRIGADFWAGLEMRASGGIVGATGRRQTCFGVMWPPGQANAECADGRHCGAG